MIPTFLRSLLGLWEAAREKDPEETDDPRRGPFGGRQVRYFARQRERPVAHVWPQAWHMSRLGPSCEGQGRPSRVPYQP